MNLEAYLGSQYNDISSHEFICARFADNMVFAAHLTRHDTAYSTQAKEVAIHASDYNNYQLSQNATRLNHE